MTTTNNTSPLAVIDDSKKQLTEALTNVTPDDFLISGILNFIRSKFLSFIIKDINDSIRKASPQLNESDLQLAQGDSKKAEETAECLIDRIWSDFYHPVMRYYQSQFQELKNQELKLKRKRTVELRKLNDRFKKISKVTSDFFLDLLKQILTQHKLDFIVPKNFYNFLDLEISPNAVQINKSDNAIVVKLVYVAHRSLLFLGSISRYRSSFSQMLAKTEHEDFNRALQYTHYSELLLPAFGEARNHIGMIYSAQGDNLSASYEFLRSCSTRIPSKLGAANYRVCMNSTTAVIDDLNRLRLEDNITNKNRYKHLSTYFSVLYGFHFNPSRWKRSESTFINGTPVKEVKNDLYKIISDLASKGQDDVFVLQKMLILLIGGISFSEASRTTSLTPELTTLFMFAFEFIDIIEKFFIEQWSVDKSKSLKLLPLIRLILSWLRNNKLALQYSHRDSNFLKTTAILLNLLFKHSQGGDSDHRPKRDQYFFEDVGLKEFIPIGRLFWDFDDGHIFEDSNSTLKLIGEFKPHDEKEETSLRGLAVGYLGKKIISANRVGIKFDDEKKLFDVSDVKDIQKKKIPGAVPKQVSPAKNEEKPITASAKRNRRRRNGKKNQQARKPVTPSYSSLSASSSSDSDSDSDSNSSGGLVEISQNSFERRNKSSVLDKGIENLSVSKAQTPQPKPPSAAHEAVLSIEELENKLTNAKKDQNYASMVDSLVDDTFSSNPVSTHTPSNNNGNTSWQSTPQYNIQQASTPFNSNDAFSPNFNNNSNGAFNQSPFMNQTPFSAYPNYYSAYQQPQPQPQQPQQPQSNMYHQYQSLYSQYQSPIPQQQPQQQGQSPFNMYNYGGYAQYAYPNIQVPQTPSQSNSQQQQQQQQQNQQQHQ